jgi:hypothetical protein
MIASRHDQQLSPERCRWFCLALQMKEEKFVSEEDFDAQAYVGHFRFQQDALEDFLVCSCLITDAAISRCGGHAHAPSIELGNSFSGGITGRGVRDGSSRFHIFDTCQKIEGDIRLHFLDLWKLIRGTDRKKTFHQIMNAARRFYYAGTRHNFEDALVDLMIAAESLYLDGQDKAELSYRLSLNAALWESSDPGRRNEVFRLFRKAYSLRSKIVHGAKPAEIDVLELFNEVRPIVKGAIIKAFDCIKKGQQMPKWETLLFKED